MNFAYCGQERAHGGKLPLRLQVHSTFQEGKDSGSADKSARLHTGRKVGVAKGTWGQLEVMRGRGPAAGTGGTRRLPQPVQGKAAEHAARRGTALPSPRGSVSGGGHGGAGW